MKLVKGCVIVFICLPMIASAATNVTLGVFGYAQVPLETELYIGGMQFENATNTPTTVYGDTLAEGSLIYVWNGVDYDIARYGTVVVPGVGFVTKWNNDPVLESGGGYWIESSSVVTSVLSGSVPMDGFITNSINPGLQLCSFPYPVDRVITNLGFNPVEGDFIYVWNGAGYDIVRYGSVVVPGVGFVTKWNNEEVPVTVGQGFWYESGIATNWIVNKPF